MLCRGTFSLRYTHATPVVSRYPVCYDILLTAARGAYTIVPMLITPSAPFRLSRRVRGPILPSAY